MVAVYIDVIAAPVQNCIYRHQSGYDVLHTTGNKKDPGQFKVILGQDGQGKKKIDHDHITVGNNCTII